MGMGLDQHADGRIAPEIVASVDGRVQGDEPEEMKVEVAK
jgi:hypothetical protein